MMSALPPKADIAKPYRHVRYVPKGDIKSKSADRRGIRLAVPDATIRSATCGGRKRRSLLERVMLTKQLSHTAGVMSRVSRSFAQCPLYPQKRASLSAIAMSALCQKRTAG